jgi:hypothetical protein
MRVGFWFVEYVTSLKALSASTLCPSRPTGRRIFGKISRDVPLQSKMFF